MVEVNVNLKTVIVRPVVCGLLKLQLDAMHRCVTVSTGFYTIIFAAPRRRSLWTLHILSSLKIGAE
jgi:hypothetical protein